MLSVFSVLLDLMARPELSFEGCSLRCEDEGTAGRCRMFYLRARRGTGREHGSHQILGSLFSRADCRNRARLSFSWKLGARMSKVRFCQESSIVLSFALTQGKHRSPAAPDACGRPHALALVRKCLRSRRLCGDRGTAVSAQCPTRRPCPLLPDCTKLTLASQM